MLTEDCKEHWKLTDELLKLGGRGDERTFRRVFSTLWTPEFSILMLAAKCLIWRQWVRTAWFGAMEWRAKGMVCADFRDNTSE